MSQSANKAFIGAFTLGAVAIVLLAIALFGSGVLFKETARFVLFFDKSINGLSVGSPVVFRGVPIGRVVAIHLAGNVDKLRFAAPVYIDLDLRDKRFRWGQANPDEMTVPEYLANLVDRGLRANLATQSLLTGQLMIELDFVPNSPVSEHQTGTYRGVPQIPTVPSTLDNVWKTVTSLPVAEIAKNLLSISDGINRLVESGHVEHVAEGIDDILKQLRNVSNEMNMTLVSIRNMADTYNAMAKEVTPRINQTLDDATKAFGSLSNVSTALSHAANQTEKTMSSAHGIVDRNSSTMMELNKTLRDIGEAARAMRSLAHTIERNPESLLRGK